MMKEQSSKMSKNWWKCRKSVESGAFWQTFKYHRYGCATKFGQRNSYVC